MVERVESADSDADIILEDPMTPREFENALAGHLTRKDRRRFWAALKEAGLLVFHA
ncbi:hypothetical protein [Edaphosphingomonas haloaromaticamans]|uniref:Uncharacterized protein n=1 Tax=Edaphosphingomonas haloaromaticamans TaxID=653954 RepID=A0A1S1HJG0_9SPHN|nr:hypothetical protein [Sphingomonas haloaromaticamans]OHT22188.1 hypothetical protein BHE75_04212 [Sphingomonas haloaromaticamans]